jgi:hypothetical protein
MTARNPALYGTSQVNDSTLAASIVAGFFGAGYFAVGLAAWRLTALALACAQHAITVALAAAPVSLAAVVA